MKEVNNFKITRLIQAPQALVFDAFTTAEHLARWWGPKGFEIKVLEFNLRPGGIFHYRMLGPDGIWWGRFTFVEIAAPNKLVWLNAFADEAGNVVPAPFGHWPLQIRNTVTFQRDGKNTLITIMAEAIEATDKEQDTFEKGFSSMNQGYSGTLDTLEIYLKQLTANQS